MNGYKKFVLIPHTQYIRDIEPLRNKSMYAPTPLSRDTGQDPFVAPPLMPKADQISGCGGVGVGVNDVTQGGDISNHTQDTKTSKNQSATLDEIEKTTSASIANKPTDLIESEGGVELDKIISNSDTPTHPIDTTLEVPTTSKLDVQNPQQTKDDTKDDGVSKVIEANMDPDDNNIEVLSDTANIDVDGEIADVSKEISKPKANKDREGSKREVLKEDKKREVEPTQNIDSTGVRASKRPRKLRTNSDDFIWHTY